MDHFLRSYGYLAIFVVIAVENVGFLVPGETILVMSAVVAATSHQFSVVNIVVTATAAAIAGSFAGFAIGRYGERHVLHRLGPYIHLGEDDLRLGRYLFQRYGGLVVFAARYVAVLRAIAPLLAGINRMDWRRFMVFTSLGAAAWAATFGFGAYALGRRIEALSARAGVVVIILVLLLVAAGFRFIQHNRVRLQREADEADRQS